MAKDLSITPAHPLTPYPFGVLSVASVSQYSESEDHWARYAAHEFDSDAFALRLLTINDDDVTNGELYDGTTKPRFASYVPFGIEVEDFSSTFSLPAQDRFKRVTKIMEAATQKAVESELWLGSAAQHFTGYTSRVVSGATVSSNFATVTTTTAHQFKVGDIVTVYNLTSASGYDNYVITAGTATTFTFAYTATDGALVLGTSPIATLSNNYLVKEKASTNVTVGAGGDTPRIALARLEGALAASPAGLRGAIHMSRRMAGICYDFLERLDFQARLDEDDVNKKGQILVTKLGTPVIVGSGYTGVGPIGHANRAVSDTTEWMFATGYVDVHLGETKVVNENLAQGITASSNTNDMRIKAVRAAAVHFEPDCHYAVRVDFSASV
jgi:hypothetical protein